MRPAWQHCNKGKPQGQKQPLEPDQVQAIADLLRSQGKARERAMFLGMVSGALRVGDLCKLRAAHVMDSEGKVRRAFRVVQSKLAGENTNIGKRTPTHAFQDVLWETVVCGAVADHVADCGAVGDDRLFPVSPCRVRQLFKDWVRSIGLKPDEYSCHSARRTAATLLYRATKDVEKVRQLLGHTSLRHTHHYLGIGRVEALTAKSDALSFLH